MGKNPYSDLPKSSFWKTGVAQENPYKIEGIYKKKFNIPANTKIATAGSCFAQHISRHLKKNGYNVLDVEPAPTGLPENLHQKFGFSMYSARYGNIYTVRQLLQLAKEVAGEWTPQNYVWEKDGKYFDALRPSVDPYGHDSAENVIEQRRYHIEKVKDLFENLDLLIFTLGLTEMWVHKESGTVYPTAPGTIVGEFDEKIYEFQNPNLILIDKDLDKFVRVLRRIRGGKKFKMILTVSPVPLTATASGHHVLSSTIYSKSTLRALAGKWAEKRFVDYFPSYEIATNPRMHSTAFTDNLRSVRNETVEHIMNQFFIQHLPHAKDSFDDNLSLDNTDVQCEESLIELSLSDHSSAEAAAILVFGNSHSNQCIAALSSHKETLSSYSLCRIHNRAIPNWRSLKWDSMESFYDNIEANRSDLIDQIAAIYISSKKKNVVIIGMNLWGDGLIRLHGPLGTSISNGETIMSKKPVIPTIANESDCEKQIIDKISSQISSALTYLRNCIDSYSEINFVWITSPAVPEVVARLIFGDEYVDSNSQVIYNKIYENLLDNYCGKLSLNSNIIVSDKLVRTTTGFLQNKYAQLKIPCDIHANAEFYRTQVIPLLNLAH